MDDPAPVDLAEHAGDARAELEHLVEGEPARGGIGQERHRAEVLHDQGEAVVVAREAIRLHHPRDRQALGDVELSPEPRALHAARALVALDLDDAGETIALPRRAVHDRPRPVV